MLFIIELIATVLVILLRIPFAVGDSGDEHYHAYFIYTNKQKRKLRDYTALNSLPRGYLAYPQLLYWILSKLPTTNHSHIVRFFNLSLDLLWVIGWSIIISIAFPIEIIPSYNYSYILAIIILGTSTIYLNRSSRLKAMGSRVIGLYIFMLPVTSIWFANHTGLKHMFASAILYAAGIVAAAITNQMSLQATITLSIPLAILNPIAFIFSLAIIIVSYISNVLGFKCAMDGKILHWKWYFQNQTSILPRSNINDYFSGSFSVSKLRNLAYQISGNICPFPLLNIIENIMTVPTFILSLQWLFNANSIGTKQFTYFTSYHPYLLATAGAVCLTMTIMYAITNFHPFRFLGQPERYFEFALPFQCIVLFGISPSLNFLLHTVFFTISFSTFFLCVNIVSSLRKYKSEKYLHSMSNLEEELLQRIASISGNSSVHINILSIPTKNAPLFASRLGLANLNFYIPFIVPHDYHILRGPGLEYVSHDSKANSIYIPASADAMINKYDIHLIVHDRLLSDPDNSFDNYCLIFSNSRYALYDVTSRTVKSLMPHL
jgi:hypothetical protein